MKKLDLLDKYSKPVKLYELQLLLRKLNIWSRTKLLCQSIVELPNCKLVETRLDN